MASPVRITLAISSLGSGGAERNLLALGADLHAKGYVVTLITLNPAIPDFYAVPQGIERVQPLRDATTSPRWFDYRGQRRRRRATRESLLATRPDLVVSFIDTTNIHVLMALTKANIPIIVSERIDWRTHRIGWRWQLLRRFWYPRAQRVATLTSRAC